MKNPYLLVVLVALSLPHIPAAEAELTCSYPQRKITIEIETDGYGIDTSWEFRIKDGPILAQNERTYDLRDSDSRELCIDDERLYELTVRDDYGDGMCCNYGKGSYKIITESDRTDNGKETILHGGKFDDTEITHLINTTKPYLSQRDQEWLDAHNTRRKTWHAHYDKSYVPLQWSEALVTEAQEWAIELLSSCKDGMYHDPDRQYGENVASNAGMGKWAVQRTPDQVMTRFVEMEVDDPWPANGHLTQALWRASNYVGCAEAHTYMTQYGKAECHTQVCRYARTGNCNMKPYISKNGKETGWIEPMLEDDNYCGPICPPLEITSPFPYRFQVYIAVSQCNNRHLEF